MTLTAEVRNALERRKKHRLASGHEVVDIYGSVGGGFVMDLDGRVFEWDLEAEPREVADPIKFRLALVAGSKAIPELKQLIPGRPSQARDCVKCGGTGETGISPEPRWLCNTCGGVGWLAAP